MAVWFYLLLPPAAMLAWEDFRTRRVSVVWLGVLGAGTLAATLLTDGLRTTLFQTAINMVFLLLMGGSMAAYLRLRRLSLCTSFGAGDAVMLAALTPMFSPAEFIHFLLTACVAALIWWAIIRSKTIPMAGVTAVLLGGYAICKACGLWN